MSVKGIQHYSKNLDAVDVCVEDSEEYSFSVGSNVVALDDLLPSQMGDLELIRGHTYNVLYIYEDGWVYAEALNSGEKGMIPATYVVNAQADISISRDVPSPSHIAAPAAVKRAAQSLLSVLKAVRPAIQLDTADLGDFPGMR